MTVESNKLLQHDASIIRDEPSQQDSAIFTAPSAPVKAPVEIGGRGGLEPTRFGDWEKGGRCIDF